MVFEEVLLLAKPCSTRKAPRRSDGRKARGTCTTPESLRPAEGMVTASSVIGVVSVGGGVVTLSERRRGGRWIGGRRERRQMQQRVGAIAAHVGIAGGTDEACAAPADDLARVSGRFAPPPPRTGRRIPFRHACVRARRSLPDRLRSRARPRAGS